MKEIEVAIGPQLRSSCAAKDALEGSGCPAERAGRRFALLHLFRVVATLMIVLHHTNMIASKNYGLSFLSDAFSRCDFRLDFIFVLSGFIITWLYADKCGKPREAGPFLQKRLMRIYPLLFTLTSLKLLFLAVAPGGRWLHESISLKMILCSYLMLPTEGYPLILGAWILPYEVCFYVLFALAIYINKKWVLGACMLWMVAILGFHFSGDATSVSDVPFFMKLRHLQIMGGVVTAIWLRQNPQGRWIFPLLGIACLLFFAGVLVLNPLLDEGSNLIPRLWWLLTFSTLIAGCVLLEKRLAAPLRLWGWLNTLGDASYSIFLIHSPVLVLGLTWLHRMHALSGPYRDGVMLALASCAVIVGVCCYRWLEKPLNDWVKSVWRLKPLCIK